MGDLLRNFPQSQGARLLNFAALYGDPVDRGGALLGYETGANIGRHAMGIPLSRRPIAAAAGADGNDQLSRLHEELARGGQFLAGIVRFDQVLGRSAAGKATANARCTIDRPVARVDQRQTGIKRLQADPKGRRAAMFAGALAVWK